MAVVTAAARLIITGMNSETLKADLKSATTCLLAAAAASDAQHWSVVRERLMEAISYCDGVLDSLPEHKGAVLTDPPKSGRTS